MDEDVCGGCSACSDPSLELEPPRRKQGAKGQALHMEEDICEDWCSGDEFEVVHQNATSTKAFSWDAKCGWRYCRSCSECKGHLSLASEKGPFDILGWFRNDADASAEEANTEDVSTVAGDEVSDHDSSR